MKSLKAFLYFLFFLLLVGLMWFFVAMPKVMPDDVPDMILGLSILFGFPMLLVAYAIGSIPSQKK